MEPGYHPEAHLETWIDCSQGHTWNGSLTHACPYCPAEHIAHHAELDPDDEAEFAAVIVDALEKDVPGAAGIWLLAETDAVDEDAIKWLAREWAKGVV